MPLVIARKRGQKIRIGNDIEIVVTRIQDGAVRLSIAAPQEISVVRDELVAKVQEVPSDSR